MLRVFNSMHELGIKDCDFKKIESEEKDTSKTGIANMLNLKDKYLVYVNHDDKHSIYLKEFDNKLETPSRILFKTLITFEPVPKEVYMLHTIGRYKSHDWAYKHKAKNLKELKKRIIDRFCDDWDKVLKDDKQIRALFWLFGENYKDIKKIKSRKNMSTIVKVFSAKNRRLAIIRQHNEWETSFWMGGGGELKEEVEFIAKAFKPSDPRYNYVSPGREFKKDIWINDDLSGKVTPKEIDLIERKCNDNDEFILVDNKFYANVQNQLRRQIISAKREQEEEDIKDKMETKAEKEWNSKGKLIRNGITFTRKKISYGDLIIEGPKIDKYIYRNNLITSENNNFNSIVAGYIDYILDVEWIQDRYDCSKGRCEYKFDGEANLKIGKVKVKLTSDKNNIYIWTKKRNRIRKDEIAKVLIRALSYEKQEEYDNFIEEVSRVSLRIKNILDGGLTFKLVATPTQDNDLSKDVCEVQITLNIKREKNKNYLILKDKKLQIRDMGKLFKLQKDVDGSSYQKYPGIQRPIKFLFDSVNDITPKDIGDLIKEGKKRFAKKVKKSREFIEHAVKITESKRVMDGYIVKGISGKEYFVGDDLQVYTWKKGEKDSYLCIIDVDSEKDIAGKNDCIAKRLLALRNDKVVAKDIYENGDKVDKYWNNI